MKVLKNLKLELKHYSCDNCVLTTSAYSNGRLALFVEGELEDMPGVYEQIAIATVNLPGEICPENEVWVKDYSENEGMVKNLIKWGVIEAQATSFARSGFVTIERFKLTKDFIKKLT